MKHSRLQMLALMGALGMAAMGGEMDRLAAPHDPVEQDPEAKTRKLNKAEKKRAKRQARNLRQSGAAQQKGGGHG